MKRRRWLKVLAIAAVLGLLVLALPEYLVWHAAAGKLYDKAAAVPEGRVGLLLGCGKTLPGGLANPFFTNRIKATAELFKAGKIKRVVVSGDNHSHGYDEPSDMREALVAAGVPEAKITCDYAGFRTLDSVARAAKVFRLKQVIIISQRFHNERALYLASHFNLDAIAFNAPGVSLRWAPSTYLRELFARVKAVLDVHVLHTEAKFYGPPFDA